MLINPLTRSNIHYQSQPQTRCYFIIIFWEHPCLLSHMCISFLTAITHFSEKLTRTSTKFFTISVLVDYVTTTALLLKRAYWVKQIPHSCRNQNRSNILLKNSLKHGELSLLFERPYSHQVLTSTFLHNRSRNGHLEFSRLHFTSTSA
jgi:hypothetical protein